MARGQMVLPVSSNGERPAAVESPEATVSREPVSGPALSAAGVSDPEPVLPERPPVPSSPSVAVPVAEREPESVPARPVEDVVPGWVGALTVVSVLVVAVAAAVASVDHLAELARLAGASGWKAWLLPASVDGLATAAALTLYVAHRTGRGAGWLPWVALLAGLSASVAGNVAAVHPGVVDGDMLKIAVGATPPLALALSVELALRQVREVGSS